MAKPDEDKALNEKLGEIRRKLLANPSAKDLQAMQLQMGALEQWARLSNLAADDHQHNHMDDHDNTKAFDQFVVLARSETPKR
jgi:hypothetical protein